MPDVEHTPPEWARAATSAGVGHERPAGRGDRRVVVTGSRSWDGAAAVRVALAEQHLIASALDLRLVVVHGACPTGADAIADTWARRMEGIRGHVDTTVEPWPADWDRHGRPAGPTRNRAMLDAGTDIVLAFRAPGRLSRGTDDCVRAAVTRRIPVLIHGELPDRRRQS